MNELTNRRTKETLDKEKHLRRAWNTHSSQQQIFDPASSEFKQLDGLCAKLEDLCGEPSRTGNTEVPVPPSRRRQLKGLRDEMRATLSNIDKKLESSDSGLDEDPMIAEAKAAARERLKLPPHLRGAALLNETL